MEAAPLTEDSIQDDTKGDVIVLSSAFFATRGVEVKISGVSKSYRTLAEEVHALQNVDWEVDAGQATAIMGPSGCGKTTLLNLLGGVDRASRGKVVVDGQDLGQATERQLERYRLLKVGFIFQLFNLIPSMTATENLELPMLVAGVKERERKERTRALLDMVGLAEKGQKRPEELSGGEQQRVAIALALANDPAVILADEPTGNLDTTNAAVIAKLLRSLSIEFKKTVIMVSHDPKVVEYFPTVYSMLDGRFV
jgi:putative ABC transport system ATP-binding protein